MEGTVEPPTIPLAGGLFTVGVPAGTEVEERGPGYDVLLLPDAREVHVKAEVIRGPDAMFAPDEAAQHTVAKRGAIVRPEGAFYRDVQPATTAPGPDGRPGRVFVRFDRYRGHTLRAAIFAPGRFDGESDASRAAADAIARRIAESAMFADRATPLDQVAPDPGEGLVHMHDVLLFALPPGWTGKEVYTCETETPEADNPVFLRAELRFRSADRRFKVDAYVAVAATEPLALEDPGGAATAFALSACEEVREKDQSYDPNVAVEVFDATPHSTGVVRTDPYDAKRPRIFRVHAFVGPERLIFAEFTITGPRRGNRVEDAATMNEIDALLRFAQPWHPRLADVLAATTRLFVRRKDADGGQDAAPAEYGGGGPPGSRATESPSAADAAAGVEQGWVGLALDMVRLPVPDGWTWQPAPPFGGCFVSADGWRLDVSVQSLFDPGALSDPGRLAEIADEAGFSSNLPDGADPLANVMIFASEYAADGTPPDRPIVLKSLERCGETHIRVLRIEVPLAADADPTPAMSAAMEAVLRADWATAATPFDRLAPSAEAKLVHVGGWFWFRLPADWTLIPKDDENASADDPDGLETVWICGALLSGPAERIDRKALEDLLDDETPMAWMGEVRETARDWLDDRDVIRTLEGEEEDNEGPLRRYHHMRVFAHDGGMAILQFDHVVDRDTDDARRAWTRQFVRDSLAEAVCLPTLRTMG